MYKTAEAVSLGHPDKTSDYISSYILDRMIEQDPNVKYAVEVMLKDNTVVLGGEITGNVNFNNVDAYVKSALRQIGYDESYAEIWKDNALNINKIKVIKLVGKQSPEINCGIVQNGWGDQGVFVGYACKGEGFINRELFLARKLNSALYDLAKQNKNLGLDIKTQITLDDDGNIETAIAAVPMLEYVDLRDFICSVLQENVKNLIVNGTGVYKQHSSVADCGITGRKLACDFYSAAAPIGGGSPWTKDASKADLSLNVYARKLAVENLHDNDEVFVYLSCCIGRADMMSSVLKAVKNNNTNIQNITIRKTPAEIIAELGLNQPIFADLCRKGISGI